MAVQRDHLVLPNRKPPSLTVKRVYLPAGPADVPGLVRQATGRVQAWTVLKAASDWPTCRS